MFTLQFGTTDKPKNSTKVPPISGSAVEVLLKEQTSVIKPVFRLHTGDKGMASASELFGYNYCYCAEFRRYYYITDIVSDTACIFYIHCEVDVLATFRDDILKTPAFIMYSESKYNPSIADTRLPKEIRSDQYTVQYPIPELDTDGSFILNVASESTAGDTGMAASFVMNKLEMQQFASQMYSRAVLDELVKFVTNPFDAILSCKWTPISKSKASDGGSAEMMLGGLNMGRYSTARKRIEGNIVINPIVRYQSVDQDGVYSYADYRNTEPYCEYSLWLPGVGIQPISMNNLIGNAGGPPPNFQLRYVASPCTGEINYVVERGLSAQSQGTIGSGILSVSGNFGVNVPVGQSNANYGGALAKGGAAAGSAAVALLATNPVTAGIAALSFTGSMISSFIDTQTVNTAVSGALDGFASDEDMLQNVYCITRSFRISDVPTRCLKTIGLPLFQTHSLGDMQGLVLCSGAYVRTWATKEEHDMMAQFINTSTNYIYGGVIIE